MRFFYREDAGAEIGPLTQSDLVAAVTDGRITPLTAVRNDINGEWVRAGRVKGLFNDTKDDGSGKTASESVEFEAAEKSPGNSKSSLQSSDVPPATPEKKHCPFCAEAILQAAIKCRFCGEFLDGRRDDRRLPVRDTAPLPARRENNPGVAAVLSFVIPGLGQIYNGEIAFGLGAGVLCAVLYYFSVTESLGILVLPVPWHVGLICAAYTSNNGDKELTNVLTRILLYILLFLVLSWMSFAIFVR